MRFTRVLTLFCTILGAANGNIDNPSDDSKNGTGLLKTTDYHNSNCLSECIDDIDEIVLMQDRSVALGTRATAEQKLVLKSGLSHSFSTPVAQNTQAETSGLRMMEMVDKKWDLKEICVAAPGLVGELERVANNVVKGLPQWPAYVSTPSVLPDVKIAFLIQVAFDKQLPLVERVFSHIYGEHDIFVYLVDRDMLDVDKVHAVLPSPLPSNVFVVEAPHAGYYYWPRVQVLLNGMDMLMAHEWDFLIHLSESDYPVHRMSWIRQSLAMQRQTNFIGIKPKCWKQGTTDNFVVNEASWYWWTQKKAVSTCGNSFQPEVLDNVVFPADQMEADGFVWASAPEWMILTREFVGYALNPDLKDFKQLISMHSAADEIFWATLVLNIPNFKQTISPQGWFQYRPFSGTGHSPQTLAETHKHLLTSNRHLYFFMRKVDEKDSADLLLDVDTMLAWQDEVPGPISGSQAPTLHAAGLECVKQGTNFGEIATPRECAALVQGDKHCGDKFMFSSSYPSWGCRCCTPTGGDGGALNPEWGLFVVSGGEEWDKRAVACIHKR